MDLRMKFRSSFALEVENCLNKSAPCCVAVLLHVSKHFEMCYVLGATNTWKVLRLNLNTSAVAGRHAHVHVADICVETDERVCFATEMGQHAFCWSGTLFHAFTECARCSVAPTCVKNTVAPFTCRLSEAMPTAIVPRAALGKNGAGSCTPWPLENVRKRLPHCGWDVIGKCARLVPARPDIKGLFQK